jgi:basic amino acid/polyamine antiporter, APA family
MKSGTDMPTKDAARPVGPLQLLALGVNGIVGVGIFFVPAAVAGNAPGMASVWVFLLTGLAAVPVAFLFAVLGRRFSEDGGPVVFARAAFGDRAAFQVGWVAYVSAFLSTAATMAGLTRALAPDLGLHGPFAKGLGATLLVTVLGLVVATGIRVSAQTWTGLTVLKLLPLFALLAAFLAFGGHGVALPAGPHEVSWLRAGLTVMFAYQGFEIVPVIAGQVRTSARSIPFATVGSLLFSILLYVGLVWACVSALPGLEAEGAPLAAAAHVYGGEALSRLVAWGTSVSALGICFGMMVTTPRYLSALASGERDLFGLDRLNGRGVPMRALLVTWVIVTLFVNMNAGASEELFLLSSIAVLTQYGVSAGALGVLAFRRERGLRPAHAALALPTIVLGVVLVSYGATGDEIRVALVAVLAGIGLAALSKARAVGVPAAP